MNLKSFLNRSNLSKYEALTKEINVAFEKINNLVEFDFSKQLNDLKDNNSLSKKQKIIQSIAIAKKAAKEVLGMPYYDVQIMGALALIDGCMAEMKTGEGKTLTCSAAVVANYVLGFSTHVATANDYLAQRDLETLAPLYNHLKLSNAFSIANMDKNQKRIAYQSVVLYSTAQEFGFDYLRDNLIYDLNEKIQPANFVTVKAIIDEADFILIDEARTPLIISGEAPVRENVVYQLLHDVALKLQKMEKEPSTNKFELEEFVPGDYWVDEKYKNVHLSESGYTHLEALAAEHGLLITHKNEKASLYHSENSWIINELLNALKAQLLYIQDKDYIVQDGQIVIIDQNTGRLSHGRTWSYGLHQAIEAKEKITINPESMTLGSISIQNYFRVYAQISGMSGTIMESSDEFEDIYQCNTIRIPTNKIMVRRDHQDKIYLNVDAKYNSLIEDILERHTRAQPILIGTTSVAESEIISNLLQKNKIEHHVLNAKNNALEAQIIAQAGQPYSVTVATSMAGRGTDIILGGNREILKHSLTTQLQQVDNRLEEAGSLMQILHDLEDFTVQISPLTELETTKPDLFQTGKNQEMINKYLDPEYLFNSIRDNYEIVWNDLFHLQQIIIKQMSILDNLWSHWREQVLESGGLCVIGSSRNESRRIDDQLRGRAGRQGDVGESVFYLSTQDSWVSMFGKNPIFSHLARTMPADQVISAPAITNAFAKIQRKIEAVHSESRKNTYQYDSIADEGRKQFLKLRQSLLENPIKIKHIVADQLSHTLSTAITEDFLNYYEDEKHLKTTGLETVEHILSQSLNALCEQYVTFLANHSYGNNHKISSQYEQLLHDYIEKQLANKEEVVWQQLNHTSLVYIDKLWTDHLIFIDEAQQNVGFRAIAQKNPLYEYKKLCFDSFSSMLDEFRSKVQEDFLSNDNSPDSNYSINHNHYKNENYSFAALTKLVENEDRAKPIIAGLDF